MSVRPAVYTLAKECLAGWLHSDIFMFVVTWTMSIIMIFVSQELSNAD